MYKARDSSAVALGRKPMRLHKLGKCPYGCIQKEAKQLLHGKLKSKTSGTCIKHSLMGKGPQVQTHRTHHLPPTGSS